jgi:DNA-binding transcriptional LysR family regulator
MLGIAATPAAGHLFTTNTQNPIRLSEERAALFHRSTRLVRLSELGQTFLRDCTELVSQANSVVDQMRDVQTKPTGTLRVHALTGLVLGNFASLLHQFQTSYPDIRMDLIVSDAVVDPVKAGVDCALQIFPASSDELISRKLFSVRRVFCATPQYLKEHEVPLMPRDLHKHKLGLYSGYPLFTSQCMYCKRVEQVCSGSAA